ncbi:MAG: class I SAM-dependent methyltransferase [Terriglobia bacterium]
MASLGSSRILESVSDTALLVAHHRAMESARPDALFHDPYAERLAGDRGEEIARRLRWGKRIAWSTITRTVLIDEIVSRLVREGVDTVLNLAAGLDARPYRLPLPPSLHWVEMDLPALIAAKTELMKDETPRCPLERVSVDLANPAERQRALAEQAGKMKRALVLTEGLLVYLNEATVSELAHDLHEMPQIQYWVCDLSTPLIVKRMQKWWGKHMKAANTRMQFGPAEGTKFFEPLGWREKEFHALFENSRRFGRLPPFMWIFKLQMKLFPKRTQKQMAKWRAGVVLLERV